MPRSSRSSSRLSPLLRAIAGADALQQRAILRREVLQSFAMEPGKDIVHAALFLGLQFRLAAQLRFLPLLAPAGDHVEFLLILPEDWAVAIFFCVGELVVSQGPFSAAG